MVQDPAVTVTFPVIGEPATSIMAWTTTPWTLPSNLALAVGKDLRYVRAATLAGHTYILAEALLGNYFKEEDLASVTPISGESLLGLRYLPVFPFFADQREPQSEPPGEKGAFRVIHSDHVTVDSGTGIVHMAPAFGEDDYFACAREGVPFVNPVDDDGMFTAEVPPLSRTTRKRC